MYLNALFPNVIHNDNYGASFQEYRKEDLVAQVKNHVFWINYLLLLTA